MKSLTFGWKRKLPKDISASSSSHFSRATLEEEQHKDDDSPLEVESDWLHLKKRKTSVDNHKHNDLGLEERAEKANRLTEEGISLAEEDRYWDALRKWNEAIQLAPSARLYEMKSQILLELHELFPAVKAAEKAVETNPQWGHAYQTLGRAQLTFGEINMAIKSFSKAKHLSPDKRELWQEDLDWALELLKQKKKREELMANVSTVECSNTRLRTASLDSEQPTLRTSRCWHSTNNSTTLVSSSNVVEETHTNFPT